jgi:hypothetical protein
MAVSACVSEMNTNAEGVSAGEEEWQASRFLFMEMC